MPINYWRRVESDHDGHVTNECLLCYGRFTGSAYGWTYCPLCGTKWLGEKEETAEQREFQLKVWDAESQRRSNRCKRRSVWVLEKREWSKWNDEPAKWGLWTIWNRLHGMNAKQALKELRHWRRVYGEDYERSEVSFSCGAEWRLSLIQE